MDFFYFSDYPEIGKRRDADLRVGVRSFPVEAYVIFYRIQDSDIVVLHVVHGRRDLEEIVDW